MGSPLLSTGLPPRSGRQLAMVSQTPCPRAPCFPGPCEPPPCTAESWPTPLPLSASRGSPPPPACLSGCAPAGLAFPLEQPRATVPRACDPDSERHTVLVWPSRPEPMTALAPSRAPQMCWMKEKHTDNPALSQGKKLSSLWAGPGHPASSLRSAFSQQWISPERGWLPPAPRREGQGSYTDTGPLGARRSDLHIAQV